MSDSDYRGELRVLMWLHQTSICLWFHSSAGVHLCGHTTTWQLCTTVLLQLCRQQLALHVGFNHYLLSKWCRLHAHQTHFQNCAHYRSYQKDVYLTDLGHRWNQPHQKDSGQGPWGKVTCRVKMPELQCEFCFNVCVCVCER